MNRYRHIPMLSVFLVAMVFLILSAANTEARANKKGTSFEVARIFFEYNSTDNDLGVHVFVDGEDWRELEIVNPKGRTIFEVEGKGPYRELGLTELFFEGAEPNLDDVPLGELLDLFPEGEYKFIGKVVDGQRITGTAMLSHAIPDGPMVSAQGGPWRLPRHQLGRSSYSFFANGSANRDRPLSGYCRRVSGHRPCQRP
jgi:hypothetical protein